jgi:(1->4)-alpha-D-glucan 1-alpha-D-glucosylmutase
MWDFSLVDPDNRRPVDFDVRRLVAAELSSRARAADRRDTCQELLQHYADGRLKLWVTMLALQARHRHRDLFRAGSYLPLHVAHGREEHVLAFARQHEGDVAIVAAPRLALTLMKGREEPPLGSVWGDSKLVLPAEAAGRRFRNIFTGETCVAGDSVLCRELFGFFPLALLALD